MELFFGLLAIAFLAYVLVMPLVVFLRQGALKREIAELKLKLALLHKDAAGYASATGHSTEKSSQGAEDVDALEGAPEESTEATLEETILDEPADALPDADQIPAMAAAAGRGDDPVAINLDAVQAELRPAAQTVVEESFASRWLVWLGGIAVALSGVFLFTYAIEQGWLVPWARVGLGMALGVGLIGAADWTARPPVAALARALKPDYVPPALAGSGVFVLFAAVFAAHGVFGLIGPAVGFAALGLVAFAGLAMALRFGWFVGALGLVAGYVTPGLIDVPDPNAAPLFLYLFALTGACLGVTLWRPWAWFGWLTMLGAVGWAAAWPALLADQAVLSAYGLGLAALYAVISRGVPIVPLNGAIWAGIFQSATTIPAVGFGATGGLLIWFAEQAGFNGASFGVLAAYAAMAVALAMWRAGLEALLIIAAGVVIVAVLAWPVPVIGADQSVAQDLGALARGLGVGPFGLPAKVAPFAITLVVLSVIFGGGGYFGLARGRMLVLWAGISTAVPSLLAVIGYWRIGDLKVDIAWAMVMAALAFAMTLAALGAARLRRDRATLAVAFYAAAATFALAFAFASLLRDAWLTVALSAQVLALAWIWSLTGVREMRRVAAIAVAVVMARLALNPFVLTYDGAGFLAFSWVIYGYGLPALALFLAARRFLAGGRDLTVDMAEAGAAALVVLMVTLQLRLWSAGSLTSIDASLFDAGV